MEIDLQLLNSVRKTLDSHQRFLMLFDESPDGDQVGASFALGMWLRSRGKSVHWVSPAPLKVNDSMEHFAAEVSVEAEDASAYDVVVLCDSGDLRRSNSSDAIASAINNCLLINIDHHASNKMYGDINIIDVEAAATCEIVYFLLKELGAEITPDMAQALLMGLYVDTGCFRHANTSKQNMAIASSLIQRGANARLAGAVKADIPLVSLRKWGTLMNEISFSNGVSSLYLSKELQQKLSLRKEELSGLSELLVTIPGTSFAIVITELDTTLKGSLRSESDAVDVMSIAQQFGGGGHKRASGFVFAKDDMQLRDKLLKLIQV